MLFFRVMLLLFLPCVVFSQSSKDSLNATAHLSALEFERATRNILETWFPRVTNTRDGGFYTNFEFDWTHSKDHEIMLVRQSRDLWSACTGHQFDPGNMNYYFAAKNGFDFIVKELWDEDKGGFYLYDWQVRDSSTYAYKLIYANAFTLFAFVEFAKIADPVKKVEVINWINKLYQWIEKNGRRQGEKGYYNIVLDQDIHRGGNDYLNFVEELGWGDPDWKDQNTSIHLLEAFTALYRFKPEEQVRTRLEELLIIVRDKMVLPGGYLGLNFYPDFTPVSFRDSSRAYIIKNNFYDHISFGHNIETAYLLVDASKALYDTVDRKTLEVGRNLVDHTLQFGFDEGYKGVWDRGYIFKYKTNPEIISSEKVWWAQAEALHALVLFSTIFPENNLYIEAADQLWQYIRQFLIDPVYGGWYPSGLDTTPGATLMKKATPWKGSYHTCRSMLNCYKYLKHDE